MPGAADISEAQFSAQVEHLAILGGWSLRYHTRDSRGSQRGWPDWVLSHPVEHRVVFAELKTASGRVSAEQYDWLSALYLAGYEVALWRPKDLPVITKVLTGSVAAHLVLPKVRPATRIVRPAKRRSR